MSFDMGLTRVALTSISSMEALVQRPGDFTCEITEHK